MLALAPLICKAYVPALIIFGNAIGRQIWFSAFAPSFAFAFVALAFGAPGTAGPVGLWLVGMPRLTALWQRHQMIQDFCGFRKVWQQLHQWVWDSMSKSSPGLSAIPESKAHDLPG